MTHASEESDDGEWREALRRNFDGLARKHRPAVYRVCLRIVGDPQRAEELTQEALLISFKKLDAFEGRSAFGSWVCGIGKNLALKAVRKHRELLTEDGVLDSADPGLQALGGLRRAEREEFMRQAAVDLLNPEEQEIVYLRYVEGMSRGRIAEIMEKDDPNEVKVILQRCKRRLERGIRHRLGQLGHGTSFFRPSW